MLKRCEIAAIFDQSQANIIYLSLRRILDGAPEKVRENNSMVSPLRNMNGKPAEGVRATEDSKKVDRVDQSALVLIVEDDPRMQKVLHRIFDGEGFRVEVAGDGRMGLDKFRALRPSAVVLDLVLPQISGRELCREMKKLHPDTPVVVLSAITEVVDKVLLLEMGADDYVTKPFSPRELLARVQAAIRRRRPTKVAATFRFGLCTADFDRMTIEREGRPVTLTALEFKLLRFLVEHAESVLTRETMLTEVWGYNALPTTRTVDNQMLKLRQKLEIDPSEPRHLLTIHGMGYKFVP
jgi:DNA-binding response OmpR family regulator